MEKSITKKILAIMMIITILAADFFVLGSNLITYAAQLNSETSNQNIDFSVYFKDGENRVDSINQNIKSADLKMYAEIVVNGEDGYLEKNATIQLQNSNFNLVSSDKGVLEGNKVTLNQINAGERVEIELGIEPIISDKIATDFLSKTSTVNFTGSYKYSEAENGTLVNADKSVCVTFKPDESVKAELETKIITNKILEVSGVNKRIVQLLVNSRLTDNQYPVEQTVLNVGIPKLNVTDIETGVETPTAPENVEVLAIGQLATNGKSEINTTDYITSDGKLQITLKNVADNGEINWAKNAYDEMVVTYIYPETVDASAVEIAADSEIKLYGLTNSYTATYTKGIENQELDQIVISRTEITTEELYKGQLYANVATTTIEDDVDIEYETKTTLALTMNDIVNKITKNEGQDAFGTDGADLLANTKYISTKINYEKLLAILGENGSLVIKNGTISSTIMKGAPIDENGNVVITWETYGESTSQLEITINNPEAKGVLELYHTKAIKPNNYSRAQLQTVKTLKTTDSSLELKETTSKAELMIDKTTLSTTEANEVTVGITLVTDGVQYDLYKNPTIALQMPSAVENVEFITEPTKLYDDANEFGTISKNYDKTNKILTISLTGEQKAYPKTALQLQMKLKVTLNQFAIDETNKITMTYTNQNANKAGVIEQNIHISAPSQLVKIFNVISNKDTSVKEELLQTVKANDVVEFEIGLINNKDTDISNLKILGKLPTVENTISDEENTLETTLKSITAENATIYYTENANATENIDDTTNGWTQELTSNAKLYLIKLDSLARGSKYSAKVAIQIPSTLNEGQMSYAQYEVIYDNATATDIREMSRKVGLMTSIVASIKTEITAMVGQEKINDGDAVKEGEVIRYTVTLTNKGKENLQNVKLKLDVPDGTVYVRPIPQQFDNEGKVIEGTGYVYEDGYYEEITNSTQLAKFTDIEIKELKTTEPFTMEYEVIVNKGIAGTKISNKPIVIYDSVQLQNIEFNNIIEESNIRVTIKRVKDLQIPILPEGPMEYGISIENLSNSAIKNLEMQVISDALKIIEINDGEKSYFEEDNLKTINISKIEPKGTIYFGVYGEVDKDAKELNTSVIIKDSDGEKYRSNLAKEILPHVSITVALESQQDGKTIKEGDIVEYNIIAKNTSVIEGALVIEGSISNYMEIQSIKVNDVITAQSTDPNDTKTYYSTISNEIYEGISLQPEEVVRVNILFKVKYIPEQYHGKTITNKLTANILNTLDVSSEVVSHVLIANNVNESVKNVISGLAWHDTNGNGRIDADEEYLSGITVKLFETSTNRYVQETRTNINGEYTFIKIPNGSYQVIFVYDTSKYVFTTANAEGVDTSINSKVSLKHINIDGKEERVAAIELSNLRQNTFNINIGLKDNTGDVPIEEQPSISIESGDVAKLKTISGIAWIDSNRNGQKDNSEQILSGITVTLYDVTIKEFIAITITNKDGKYTFENIEKGSYIIIFEYDTEKYEPTTYMADGVESSAASKVVVNTMNINGQEQTVAVTDTINVQSDVTNINIGLREKLMFDLELDKYISRIVVQNNKKTKAYDYNEKTLAKVEINKKQLPGSLVVLEYTIKVRNIGEVSGYVKNVVDYLPAGLTFSSELNKDWYLADNNLYTKSLENIELKPGEEKELKLILTKTMTNENTGLINNRAEIYQDYNKYGKVDIDSKPNNQVQDEDDFGYADVIIGISTGGSNMGYFILLMINAILIGIAIRLMIKNGIIKISRKIGRR